MPKVPFSFLTSRLRPSGAPLSPNERLTRAITETLVAVNRPPGCKSRFERFVSSLFGLIDATSNCWALTEKAETKTINTEIAEITEKIFNGFLRDLCDLCVETRLMISSSPWAVPRDRRRARRLAASRTRSEGHT